MVDTGQAIGEPPRTGWANLVPELAVTDLDVSLSFWRGLLGFAVAYARVEELFAYLERPEGAQIMLCQRNGRFETGAMESPFGRGAMFQIYVASIEPIVAALAAAKWPLYRPPRDQWRRIGDREGGQREFFVQDPDGYLIMVAHDLGDREIGRAA